MAAAARCPGDHRGGGLLPRRRRPRQQQHTASSRSRATCRHCQGRQQPRNPLGARWFQPSCFRPPPPSLHLCDRVIHPTPVVFPMAEAALASLRLAASPILNKLLTDA
uniref:Uncharacterized protein n=1 Tax=Oryza meridionalis TaxID=40149 RepID=A0A0E0DQK5_9ORYZ